MPTRRRLPATAALLACAALVAAGCGSSEPDQPSAADAQSSFKAIRASILDLGAAIAATVGTAEQQRDAELMRAFAELEARGQTTVARLNALDVPADLRGERDALRDALAAAIEDVADIADAGQARDVAAVRRAAEQFLADSQTVRDARRAFDRALEDATT